MCWITMRQCSRRNLNENGIERIYTIWGKENLMDAAWHSPTNAADRFFKVSVEMP